MRFLLLSLLTLVGLMVLAPQWVRHYSLSQISYFIQLRWLLEIKDVVFFWEWIPKQCSVETWTKLWGFINTFCAVPCVFFYYRKHDMLWRIVALCTIVMCAIYSADVVRDYVLCTPTKGQVTGKGCPSIIEDGVNSVSILMWWVDGLVIHPLSLIIVLVEGWRVRMPLFKVLLYGLFANAFTQIAALPLFFLEWRNYRRTNDAAWALGLEPDSSCPKQPGSAGPMERIAQVLPVSLEEESASSPSASRRSKLSASKPKKSSRAAAAAAEEPADEQVADAGEHDSALGEQEAPSTLIRRKKSTSTPSKARKSKSTPKDEDRDLDEESKSAETPVSRVSRSASRRREYSNNVAVALAAATMPVAPASQPNASPEPGVIPSDSINMSALVARWWSWRDVYAAEVRPSLEAERERRLGTDNPMTAKEWNTRLNDTVTNSMLHVLKTNPSPINVRPYPTMSFSYSEHFSVRLDTLLPIVFLVVGIWEGWTWLTWMSTHVRVTCWLWDFFDYALDSPSSMMMTTGGFWGLFIWGTFMNSVEPDAYRKYNFYPFLMLTFHNVACGMAFYTLWREFRMRYLRNGADRSVWATSKNPNAYFVLDIIPTPESVAAASSSAPGDKCPPIDACVVDHEQVHREKQQQERMRDRMREDIWTKYLLVCFEWVPKAWAYVSGKLGCTWLGRCVAKFWDSLPWMHNPLHDLWAFTLNSIKLNWEEVQSFLSTLTRFYMHLQGSAPLPTPAPRLSLIDWTLFVPFLIITWALCLNAYVFCWWFDLNSAARGMFSFINLFVTLFYVHYWPNESREMFVWFNYDASSERQAHAQSTFVDDLRELEHTGQVMGANMLEETPEQRDRRQAEDISRRAHEESAHKWYREFSWNIHLIWTLTLTFLYFLATVTLIKRVEFDLPWWSAIYEAFRQQAYDSIHRGPAANANVAFLALSLLLAYPLFFGFTLPRCFCCCCGGKRSDKSDDSESKDRGMLGLPNMGVIMKLLLIAPLLVTFGAAWTQETQPCFIPLGVEGPSPTDAEFADMSAAFRNMVTLHAAPSRPGLPAQHAARPVHPKTHGCLAATFSTRAYTVPAKFRAGLFDKADPANGNSEWHAFVRFSNGALQSRGRDGVWRNQADKVDDVRGMAVKLLQVKGEKALNASELAAFPERLTQDFLAITSDYFFQSNATNYAGFIAALTDGTASTFLRWLLPSSVFSLAEWRGFAGRARTLWNAYRMNVDGAGVLNPLDVNYYSAVPYRLGPEPAEADAAGRAPQAVKYRWKPCRTHGDRHHPRGMSAAAERVKQFFSRVKMMWGRLTGLAPSAQAYETMTQREREAFTAQRNPENFLRINLQSRLDPSNEARTRLRHERERLDTDALDTNAGEEICFDLMLQDQINACQNKIEDAETPWVQDWVRVGRLTIHPQRFLSSRQLGFCDALSFNPWHSLKAHRPLGAINAMRKYAYLTAASTRRELNGVNNNATRTADYKGDELTKLGKLDGDLEGDCASYSYANYSVPYQFLPKMIATMPNNETMTNDTRTDIMYKFLFAGRSLAYPQDRIGHEWTGPQDYEYYMLGRKGEPLQNNTNHYYSGRMRRPAHVATSGWTSDAWWAAQFIQGLNPMMIHRVKMGDKPNGVKLPDALVQPDAKMRTEISQVLSRAGDRASTLEDLMKEGRLFFVDYWELTSIETFGDRVLMAPLVLLFLPSTEPRQLLPLFIQLDRPAALPVGTRPRVYFPRPLPEGGAAVATNEQLVWLFAKMHVSSADATAHQMIYHLCECHLAMEPTIIATHRAFAPDHPVRKILRQHFTGTLAINDFGRDTLLSDMTAQLDQFLAPGLQGSMQLMQAHYNNTYRWMETLPQQLARRGFDVTRPMNPANWGKADDELPGFFYRDYGLRLWYTMRRYVEEVFSKHKYGSSPADRDRAFRNDDRLRAWYNELASPSNAGIHGVAPFASFDQLVDVVTQIMFQGSAQHAAVNFAQFEFQAFQPARPLFLRRGMPADTALVTNGFILKSLMDLKDVEVTNSVFDILSACCINTLMLDLSEADGLIQPKTTIAPAYPEEYERFKAHLREIEREMKANNAAAGVNYPYLYPSRIPQSIAI